MSVEVLPREKGAKLERKKKRGKKRPMRYSTGLGGIQKAVRAFNHFAVVGTDGLSIYMREFDKEWDKEAKQRRDGGLREMYPIFGKSLTRSLVPAGDMPRRVTKTLPRPNLRLALRVLFPPLWFIR